MSKYDEGCKQNARVLVFPSEEVAAARKEREEKERRAREELEKAEKNAAKAKRERCINALIDIGIIAVIVGMTLYAMFATGCAVVPLAEKSPLVELKQPVALSGLVQIAQMGTECKTSSEEEEVQSIIRDFFSKQGALVPDMVELRLLSGSSLCGPAQGLAEPVKMPGLGAYNTARAEAKLYWKGGITESELDRAEQVFNLLRIKPIRHRPTVARHPANK